MAEYIEREAAVEAAKHAWGKGLEPTQYIEIIPAADVALAASVSSGGSQMKSRYIRPYSKREKKAMGETAERQTRRSLEKVQWVMIVALNDALGVGEERFLRVFDRYTELLEEYGGFKEDEVADEMLSRRVKQILPKSFTKLYME